VTSKKRHRSYIILQKRSDIATIVVVSAGVPFKTAFYLNFVHCLIKNEQLQNLLHYETWHHLKSQVQNKEKPILSRQPADEELIKT
jgi:hypothetical protein